MATGKQSFVAVVDDDVSVREAIVALLNSAGFTTLGYPSAEAFLRSKRARKARCLLLDMRLPGKSGLQLHCQLREQGRDTPTFLLTADHDRDGRLRAQALDAGIVAVLYKPFDAEALVRLVKSAFEKPRG